MVLETAALSHHQNTKNKVQMVWYQRILTFNIKKKKEKGTGGVVTETTNQIISFKIQK